MGNARPVVPPPAIDRAKLADLRWLVEEFHYEYAAVLDRCEREAIAYLPWFPLGGGSVARGTGLRADDPVREIADRRRMTPTQVALAWLLHRSPVMVPIPGTSRVTHLEENVAAASVQLTAEELHGFQ